jgi:16S rRNA (uracil1498-N3)-methyltransferase
VVDRRDHSLVRLFGEPGSFASGREVSLSGDSAHHARVRRVGRDDQIQLVDGEGQVAIGRVAAIGKNAVTVAIDRVEVLPRPVPLEVMVPVADRDRMLFAAEKCVELQVTAWRPVYFARSRSVSPRGEGPKFHEKVRARMRSALEQSGGAWMPVLEEEMDGIDALRVKTDSQHLLLDIGGEPLAGLAGSVPTVIAVGPEGGLEPQELAVAAESGWIFASLGTTTLRFETAIIAAAAVIRATQLTHRSS